MCDVNLGNWLVLHKLKLFHFHGDIKDVINIFVN